MAEQDSPALAYSLDNSFSETRCLSR